MKLGRLLASLWVLLQAICLCLGKYKSTTCLSPVFCRGPLLDTVQRARIFEDSKTFVDMKIRTSEQEVLENFEFFLEQTYHQPTKDKIREFVEANFEHGKELEPWMPPDFNPKPKFLDRITMPAIREFTQALVAKWPPLGRVVKSDVAKNPELYSIIPLPNGFIIAGGRFKEFYYWDSYWITNGLLICEMHETVRGILENLISCVDRFGFIPNGGRVYYLNRSQPPVLTPMVRNYIQYTNNLQWLKNNIVYLEKELYYWFDKTVQLEKRGEFFTLARYDVRSRSPRPESYIEDIETAAIFKTREDKEKVYTELKCGAESGWDFSSRWFFDELGGNHANLSFIKTRRVVPVDLNAFLARSFGELSEMYILLNDTYRSSFWKAKEDLWKENIHQILWNEKDGIWYDYDIQLKRPRKYWYPSNMAPLWTKSYPDGEGPRLGQRVLDYLNTKGILHYCGGTPTSLEETGEQWDFPNAWPPLQAIVIQGLNNSGYPEAQEIATDMAKVWVRSNLEAYHRYADMLEKYHAEDPGDLAGGGEYELQKGFGWTNGVFLELIYSYFARDAPPPPPETQETDAEREEIYQMNELHDV